MPRWPARNVDGTFMANQPVKRYRMHREGGRLQLVHRLRAERALGKPLPATAQVHHVDGTKSEHAQLVICDSDAYHKLLHARTRIVKAGGNPNTERICNGCKALKPIGSFTPAAAARGDWQCKGCPAKAARERRRALKEAA